MIAVDTVIAWVSQFAKCGRLIDIKKTMAIIIKVSGNSYKQMLGMFCKILLGMMQCLAIWINVSSLSMQ